MRAAHRRQGPRLEPRSGARGLGRTQWVDQTIWNVRDALLQKGVDWAWLPRELPSSAAPRPHSVEEFGCGAYGCVMPTNQDGLVLKLTSDGSEAWFAQIAQELSRKEGWPAGIVHYRRVVGLADQTLENQPLYLLWRTEAFEVGKLGPRIPLLSAASDDYMQTIDVMHEDGDLQAQRSILSRAAAVFDEARNYMFEELQDGRQLIEIVDMAAHTQSDEFRIAVRLACLYAIAEDIESIESEYGTRGLGGTIRYYMDKGLLLTDLHMGNLGLDAEGTVVIADPGLVVPLKSPWFDKHFPKRLLVRS